MANLPLALHIERWVPLEPVVRERLRSLPRRTLKRRQIVSRVGDASTPLYYVESGLLRLSGIEGVRERTYQFALEGWWLTDWSGFEGAVAEFEIQAVEASEVVALTKEEHEQLLRDAPVLEGYFRRVFQRAWAAAQRRLMLHETQAAEAMYRAFVSQYPDFVQRVPQYMLASFLGFTPEFLSRLRARRS